MGTNIARLMPLSYEDDDEATPIACQACGGDHNHQARATRITLRPGSYSVSECRWCNMGRMTPKQRVKWDRHRQRVHESGVRRKVEA